MTTPATGRKLTSACDGVSRTFANPKLLASGDLKVYLLDSATAANSAGTLLSEGADYALAADLSAITTTAAYPLGKFIRRWRSTSRKQGVEIVASAGVPAATQEGALDRLSLVDEEQDDDLSRTVQVPPGEAIGAIPAQAVRAGKYAAWDVDGEFVASAGTGNDPNLRTDLVASSGASLISFLSSGVGALARSLQSKLRETFSILDYGANGAAGSDDASVILKLANAANGNVARLGVGQFRADATIAIPVLAHIRGAGDGEGPGTLAGNNCTQIIANFADGHLWDMTPSLIGPTIERVQFNSYLQRNSGAAIHLKGTGVVTGAGPYVVTGSVIAGYRIAKCAFNSQATGILIDVGGWGEVTRTYHQAWKSNAIETNGNGVQYLGTSYGNETEAGWINKNMFFGDTAPGTAQHAAFYSRGGYYKFSENHVLGAQFGIWQEVSQYPAGGIEIRGNLFEEQDIASIYLTPLGGAQTAAMVKIHDNEFALASLGAAARVNFQGHIAIIAGSASWINDVSICLNVMRSTAARAAYAFIEVQSGANVLIADNILDGLTGNTMKGIEVSAQAQTVYVLDNVIKGAFGTRYTLTANCLLRDFMSGLTAAEVNAITCANGSTVWVADGDPANPTLTGGSTGCIAVRRGGTWSPLLTLHGAVAGYGTPTGGARLANFPGATATLAQTSGALAQLLLDLKGLGELKA